MPVRTTLTIANLGLVIRTRPDVQVIRTINHIELKVTEFIGIIPTAASIIIVPHVNASAYNRTLITSQLLHITIDTVHLTTIDLETTPTITVTHTNLQVKPIIITIIRQHIRNHIRNRVSPIKVIHEVILSNKLDTIMVISLNLLLPPISRITPIMNPRSEQTNI